AQGCEKPKTPKNTARCAASQSAGASPSLPAMTERSRGASLSNRTTEETFRPVPDVAAMDAMSGPLRGTDVMKQTTRSGRRSWPPVVVARDHEGGAPLVAGQIGERETGEDDAAEREHSAGALDEIGVGVELGLVGQPVQGSASLGDGRHWGISVFEQLDDHVDPGIGGDATAGEFGRELSGLSIKNDLVQAGLPLLAISVPRSAQAVSRH